MRFKRNRTKKKQLDDPYKSSELTQNPFKSNKLTQRSMFISKGLIQSYLAHIDLCNSKHQNELRFPSLMHRWTIHCIQYTMQLTNQLLLSRKSPFVSPCCFKCKFIFIYCSF